MYPRHQVRRQHVFEGGMEVQNAVVEDDCRRPVIEGGGTGDKVAAQAVAEQSDLVWCHFLAGQGEIDDRRDHFFPVMTERQFRLADGRTLARAVEREHVVATTQGCRTDGDIRFLLGRIEAVVVDDGRFGFAGAVGQEQIAGQRRILVGDLDDLERRIEQLGGLNEGLR
ncbi:hypothetical protein D9M71_669390 [compost metagenome]